MTQIQTATAQELKGTALLQFPADLTWEAEYHIRVHFQSDRTEALVKAALSHRYFPD